MDGPLSNSVLTATANAWQLAFSLRFLLPGDGLFVTMQARKESERFKKGLIRRNLIEEKSFVFLKIDLGGIVGLLSEANLAT